MIKRVKSLFNDRKGLTLVETLVAITILALVLFCITPLFLANLDTIRISGDKAVKVYNNAGIMQKILANFETGDDTDNAGYAVNVANTSITLSGNGINVPINAQGNLLVSNPNDISDGYSTVMADSPDSTFQVFPKSLTDDFKEAYLTVAAIGFSFVDEPGSSIYELYCNKNGTETKLTYGKDYTMRRLESTNPKDNSTTVSNRVMQIVLYGGTDVSFSNSPLIFKYKNYKKEIQVDAPKMIMVGEKSSEGYRYYVSRGETEKDSEGKDRLIVLERYMDNAPLTSAMNDVEWVPAENGDGNNVVNGDKYGYYVMCGDNGQVRRFWKNPTTGNYYWGGDDTYYTDIDFNTITQEMKFNGTKTRSGSVSYKYVTRRDNTQTSDHWRNGFNMSNNADVNNSLLCANVWSVTGFGDDDNATFFYASDGKAPYYMTKKGVYNDSVPLYSKLLSAIESGASDETHVDLFGNVNKLQRWKDSLGVSVLPTESYTWIKATQDQIDAYYMLTGQKKATTIPITLTSADAIVLSGSGGGYYDNPESGSHEMPHAAHNVDYPTQSYTLYCGYIPAAMDAWSKTTNFTWESIWQKDQFEDDIDVGVNATSKLYAGLTRPDDMDKLSDAMLGTDAKGQNNGNRFIKWKGNFGVTPYLTKPESIFSKNWVIDVSETGHIAVRKKHPKQNIFQSDWDYFYENVAYYPYKNLSYAITGKFYDSHTDITGLFKENTSLGSGKRYKALASLAENRVYNTHAGRQGYITNGKVVDITLAYLSHPLATHIAANPTDDMVYDMSNDKTNKIFYWNNSRETVTFLDCASTTVPDGENDIPVSLMVGYVMGGMAEYWGGNIYVNNVMNNGIVYLRAGTANIGTQDSNNSHTGEYYAKDADGYKLNKESNVFHQFYYLNSRTVASTKPEAGKHIGDLYGAHFWQNNQHVDFVSMNGGEPGTGYNYLRCHPMSNTKVTCVAWGQTWDYNPEAMWGTENGTVLSWFVDLDTAKDDGEASNWNDRSVSAEFQSYKWVDNANGRKFDVKKGSFDNTVGANGTAFNVGNSAYEGFYDKCSRSVGTYTQVGMISVLETINDIAFYDDIWVAVGNQSGKAPAQYCPSQKISYANNTFSQAYTSGGWSGSWINVRHWIDYEGDGIHDENNNKYAWTTVKISDDPNYNIVQINVVNGVWYATGYADWNKNGEWDAYEKAVVCWARDPLAACDSGADGCWSENTQFYRSTGSGQYQAIEPTQVGGINSVACRDDM